MITILENSPLQYSGNTSNPHIYLLNDDDFESKLYFTSSGNTLYYAILRIDSTETITIAAGKLSGHYNSACYDYRFDFNNYINIDNQMTPDLKSVSAPGLEGPSMYYFLGNNSTKLYFVLSKNEIINSNLNAGNLSNKSNGEIIIASGRTISNLIVDDTLFLKFVDKKTNNDIIKYPTDNKAIADDIYILTVYNYIGQNSGDIIFNITKSGSIEYYFTSIDMENYDYIVYLIQLPDDLTNFTISDLEGLNIINPKIVYNPICCNRYYYMSDNGAFDVLKCTGTMNQINNITKKNYKLGNKLIQTKISVNKQIKQNTGFNLNEEQLYSFINSPVVYTVDGSGTIREYTVETNSFDGYNNVKLSGKNIELILTDQKKYQQKTNYEITFFD